MTYRRHPLDIGPLVLGLIFLGTVVAWALFEVGVASREDATWILPGVLIAAGAIGVLLAATRSRREEARLSATPEGVEAPTEPLPSWSATPYASDTPDPLDNHPADQERDDD